MLSIRPFCKARQLSIIKAAQHGYLSAQNPRQMLELNQTSFRRQAAE